MMTLPYLMVFVIIALFWIFFSIEIGPIQTQQQAISRALFKDAVMPSLWAVPILIFIHMIKIVTAFDEKKPPTT
ncbi:hypothetical protein [Hymenobacter sp.]|uniref:hypothetical protein n=1 Tax=Hymenobacter sp. TaxID=1898978 RepID=UPI002EDB2BEA